jgi:hypothetical protein
VARTILVALAALTIVLQATSTAAAEEATYSAIRTVPVPPASNFKTGGGGGDGWAVALSETAVYNVFHHSEHLTVACHLQASGASCFSPETITDGEGHNFATSGHPGMYLDQETGRLYVFATRASDETAGVVCIDTKRAVEESDPFCGFTALSPVGQGPPQYGISGVSTPMLLGSHWYAFNQMGGVNVSGAENELLCFDVSTDAACAGQPFDVPFGEGLVSTIYPGPPSAAIGSHVIVPLAVEGKSGIETRMACFDDATQQTCAGEWPLAPGITYAGANGSPFPLLDKTGKLLGFCLPTGADQCYTLKGALTATPSGMPAVIESNDEWNGPSLVIGPRVYVPNGLANNESGDVECFDYATGADCTNFPKTFSGLEYLYTVNADPQRPSCIWVNADSGSEQIQDFDAYTGEACGSGPARGLATQFVAAGEQCKPSSYVSLHVLHPETDQYTSGSIEFRDGDGEPISGLEAELLDAGGNVSLEGMHLNTETGLPQFLFKFTGLSGELGLIEVRLTWKGDYSANCGGEGRIVTLPEKVEPAPEVKATTETPTSSVGKQTAAAAAVLACTTQQVALTNVVERGSSVWIEGVTRLHLAGRTVHVKLLATGHTVALAKVLPDGTFTASAPLPPRALRHSNRVRYQAVVGSSRSLSLKLYRRMTITATDTSQAGVLVEGKVAGPFSAGAEVSVFLTETCSTRQIVGYSKLTAAGTFSVTVPAPAGPSGEIDLYRASTTVLYHGRAMRTWTLPTAPLA